MNYSQSETQTSSSNADAVFPYLVKFNEESAEIFWKSKPPWMSELQWLDHPSNPYRLPEEAMEGLTLMDDMNHTSGKGTYFRQYYLAKRLGKSLATIRLWIRRYKHLGIISVSKVFHYRMVNSYQVKPEFSKYKCVADGSIGTCSKEDHSQCVRPQVDYTCTSCNRFRSGMSVEQQHQKEIDTIKNNYNQEIQRLKLREENLKNYREWKKKDRRNKRETKANKRDQFLAKLKPQQVGVIKSYEAVTGRRFDIEKDYQGWIKLNKLAPVNAIIGIVQSAINLLARVNKNLATTSKSSSVEIDNVEYAPIYSLKYCVKQAETIEKLSKETFQFIGKEVRISESIMGYLGRNLAELNQQTMLDMLKVLKEIPIKYLGEKQGLKSCLGVLAAKRVSLEVKEGNIPEEEKAEAFNEYIQSLLIEFGLRC